MLSCTKEKGHHLFILNLEKSFFTIMFLVFLNFRCLQHKFKLHEKQKCYINNNDELSEFLPLRHLQLQK